MSDRVGVLSGAIRCVTARGIATKSPASASITPKSVSKRSAPSWMK
jgi:hypothetical protein